MSSQSNTPGAAIQQTNGGTLYGSPWLDVSGGGWSNISNLTSGTTGATLTISGGGTGEVLTVSDYGFTIPTSMTLNGIGVALLGSMGGSRTKQYDPYVYGLSPAASAPLSDTSQPFLSTGNTVTYGGPTSLAAFWGWATAPTSSVINASNFGFGYQPQSSNTNSTLTINSITMAIYYTASAPAVQQMLGLLGVGCSFAVAAEIARRFVFCQRRLTGRRPLAGTLTQRGQFLSAWREHRSAKRSWIAVPG